MALERIDPFFTEDRFCLDHLLRYLWSTPLLECKTVLDVACGTGFGSALMANANAAAVVGVDSDASAVEECNGWKLPNASFRCGRMEELPQLGLEAFDCVVSFETLEHVADPLAAIQAIKGVMKEDGLFIGSVPGETDLLEPNAYHLHHFGLKAIQGILGQNFRHYRILRQQFQLASVLTDTAADEEPHAITNIHSKGYALDFGKSPDWADTFVFMASDAPLPECPETNMATSRQAWYGFFEQAQKAFREVHRLSKVHEKLFIDHGELVRRFTNVLGWGSYHFEKSEGKEPDQHYIKTIVAAQSTCEKQLRLQVKELQEEVEALKSRLRSLEGEAQASIEKRKGAFFSDIKEMKSSESRLS